MYGSVKATSQDVRSLTGQDLNKSMATTQQLTTTKKKLGPKGWAAQITSSRRLSSSDYIIQKVKQLRLHHPDKHRQLKRQDSFPLGATLLSKKKNSKERMLLIRYSFKYDTKER